MHIAAGTASWSGSEGPRKLQRRHRLPGCAGNRGDRLSWRNTKEIGGYRGPESGAGYIDRMNRMWGWLIIENVAPVWIGEMGASMTSAASKAWGQTLLDYVKGEAPGGPTFSGSQQPIGDNWWAWGCLSGQNPNGCVGEDGKVRPEQAPLIGQMLFRPVRHAH